MKVRKEVHKQFIVTKENARNTDNVKKRDIIEAKVNDLRESLKKITVDHVNFDERLDYILSNRGLKEVFDAYWFVLTSYFDKEEILTQEGFRKYKHAVTKSLEGYDMTPEELEMEWKNDNETYGEMSKYVFFQVLYDAIDVWTDMVDASYYAAFGWAVLESILDVTQHPPRIKSVREIPHITKTSTEANMIRNYVRSKRQRTSLFNEWEMNSNQSPQVQKRLTMRKMGVGMDDGSQLMLERLRKRVPVSIEETQSDSVDTADGGGVSVAADESGNVGADADASSIISVTSTLSGGHGKTDLREDGGRSQGGDQDSCFLDYIKFRRNSQLKPVGFDRNTSEVLIAREKYDAATAKVYNQRRGSVVPSPPDRRPNTSATAGGSSSNGIRSDYEHMKEGKRKNLVADPILVLDGGHQRSARKESILDHMREVGANRSPTQIRSALPTPKFAISQGAAEILAAAPGSPSAVMRLPSVRSFINEELSMSSTEHAGGAGGTIGELDVGEGEDFGEVASNTIMNMSTSIATEAPFMPTITAPELAPPAGKNGAAAAAVNAKSSHETLSRSKLIQEHHGKYEDSDEESIPGQRTPIRQSSNISVASSEKKPILRVTIGDYDSEQNNARRDSSSVSIQSELSLAITPCAVDILAPSTKEQSSTAFAEAVQKAHKNNNIAVIKPRQAGNKTGGQRQSQNGQQSADGPALEGLSKVSSKMYSPGGLKRLYMAQERDKARIAALRLNGTSPIPQISVNSSVTLRKNAVTATAAATADNTNTRGQLSRRIDAEKSLLSKDQGDSSFPNVGVGEGVSAFYAGEFKYRPKVLSAATHESASICDILPQNKTLKFLSVNNRVDPIRPTTMYVPGTAGGASVSGLLRLSSSPSSLTRPLLDTISTAIRHNAGGRLSPASPSAPAVFDAVLNPNSDGGAVVADTAGQKERSTVTATTLHSSQSAHAAGNNKSHVDSFADINSPGADFDHMDPATGFSASSNRSEVLSDDSSRGSSAKFVVLLVPGGGSNLVEGSSAGKTITGMYDTRVINNRQHKILVGDANLSGSSVSAENAGIVSNKPNGPTTAENGSVVFEDDLSIGSSVLGGSVQSQASNGSAVSLVDHFFAVREAEMHVSATTLIKQKDTKALPLRRSPVTGTPLEMTFHPQQQQQQQNDETNTKHPYQTLHSPIRLQSPSSRALSPSRHFAAAPAADAGHDGRILGSGAFPHEIYTDLVDLSLDMRVQPPSSPVMSHIRAMKSVKGSQSLASKRANLGSALEQVARIQHEKHAIETALQYTVTTMYSSDGGTALIPGAITMTKSPPQSPSNTTKYCNRSNNNNNNNSNNNNNNSNNNAANSIRAGSPNQSSSQAAAAAALSAGLLPNFAMTAIMNAAHDIQAQDAQHKSRLRLPQHHSKPVISNIQARFNEMAANDKESSGQPPLTEEELLGTSSVGSASWRHFEEEEEDLIDGGSFDQYNGNTALDNNDAGSLASPPPEAAPYEYDDQGSFTNREKQKVFDQTPPPSVEVKSSPQQTELLTATTGKGGESVIFDDELEDSEKSLLARLNDDRSVGGNSSTTSLSLATPVQQNIPLAPLAPSAGMKPRAEQNQQQQQQQGAVAEQFITAVPETIKSEGKVVTHSSSSPLEKQMTFNDSISFTQSLPALSVSTNEYFGDEEEEEVEEEEGQPDDKKPRTPTTPNLLSRSKKAWNVLHRHHSKEGSTGTPAILPSISQTVIKGIPLLVDNEFSDADSTSNVFTELCHQRGSSKELLGLQGFSRTELLLMGGSSTAHLLAPLEGSMTFDSVTSSQLLGATRNNAKKLLSKSLSSMVTLPHLQLDAAPAKIEQVPLNKYSTNKLAERHNKSRESIQIKQQQRSLSPSTAGTRAVAAALAAVASTPAQVPAVQPSGSSSRTNHTAKNKPDNPLVVSTGPPEGRRSTDYTQLRVRVSPTRSPVQSPVHRDVPLHVKGGSDVGIVLNGQSSGILPTAERPNNGMLNPNASISAEARLYTSPAFGDTSVVGGTGDKDSVAEGFNFMMNDSFLLLNEGSMTTTNTQNSTSFHKRPNILHNSVSSSTTRMAASYGDLLAGDSVVINGTALNAAKTKLNPTARRAAGAIASEVNPVLPWVPRGTLIPPDTNRSNVLIGWKEKMDVVKKCPSAVSASTSSTLIQQRAVRAHFEEFARQQRAVKQSQ